MKKKIFALIALAAAFVGCSKEASETPSPAVEGQKFVITASVGDPATRLGYVENDQKGFTAKFTSSEKISLYFLKADNSVALSRVLNIDGYSISDDGRTAKFETTDLVIPTDAVKLAAYLYSGSGSAYSDEKATTDLSLQANLGAAQSHHILYTTLNTSDIKVDENGISTANIKFAYKTALLRFTLTFPEDVKVTMDNKTVITLTNANNTVHNALDIVWGELAETSAKGDIVFYPTDTLDKKNVAVAYACVWAGDNFKDSKLSVAQGDDTYSVDLELKKETLEAGKVYDVTRTLTAAPKPVSMWANDDAASVDFKYSGGEEVTNDWLSCKDGKISWTANTTGVPRYGKLSFKNGASFDLTQFVAADFKGDWTVKSRQFGGTGYTFTNTVDKSEIPVVFGEPLSSESLPYGDKTITNTFGIRGMALNLVMDACVSDIDYENKSAKLGLFFDGRKAQKITEGTLAGKYGAFLPELCGDTWKSGYEFGRTDLGTPDYEWLWMDVTTENGVLQAQYLPFKQRISVEHSYKRDYIIGIEVMKFNGEDANDANLIRGSKTNTENGDKQADWITIYQANYGSKDAGGLTLVKK